MAKAGNPKTKSTIGALSDQMRAFAMHYTTDWNGKAAAIRAGYSERSAAAQASKLLAREDIQALIQERMTRIEQKTEITTERALQEAWGIATADVRELVEYRVTCCRHCYGIEHGYQRTVAEMNRDRRSFDAALRRAKTKADKEALGDFDEAGGIGYDGRKAPVASCTNCWGVGVGQAVFKDTRHLSREAAALYAGVKITKEGVQMLTVDKLGGLEKVFKHLGLYKADNKQKADGFAEFFAAIAAKGGKLPIKK